MAVLTPSLTRLRSGYNKIAPNRDKASDGWIGDLAHQYSPSGHNPDESGNAESWDADSIDEVRAIDIDKDLRVSGLTMQMCVQKILATPNDRKRLLYIIWNRTIWSASSGWAARAYYGDNLHTEHAHFSGNPAYDNDDSPWGIEQLNGGSMDLTTPLYLNGPNLPKAVGDLHYAEFKGNLGASVVQQALRRIELTQKAILTAAEGINEEGVLAAVNGESAKIQETVRKELAASEEREKERDAANVTTLLAKFSEVADPASVDKLRTALRDVFGEAFDSATDSQT